MRRVGSDGCVSVDERSYYVGLAFQGKTVALAVDASAGQFKVWEGSTLIKQLLIKGVQGAPMPLEPFIAWMREQAVSEEQRARLRTQTSKWRQRSLWDEVS